MSEPAILWFRQDLRLCDNPALAAAFKHATVIPVYIWAPEEEGGWPPGGASKWWLWQSLMKLSAELEKRGSRLLIRRGPTSEALAALIEETGATAVYWNRRYEPAIIARDKQLKTELQNRGLIAESFNSNLLFEPWTIKNKSGEPFKVFTAFWRTCLTKSIPPPLGEAEGRFGSVARWPQSLAIADLGLAPKPDWAAGLRAVWQPGEAGARQELKRFLDEAIDQYPERRDRPAANGTSRLSPHMHFGEISPAEIWRAASELAAGHPRAAPAYLRQVIWREFAYHLLYHFPESPEKPLRPEFAAFPWRHDGKAFQAWTKGSTGFPLVDAGMRQLWETGWMHNRVRMVAASFLVKDLLLPWQHGAAWFWDTLVDADLANNTLGWQWVAGCGADAAPYFRIFNPSIQASKFDPDRAYARRWIAELNGGDYPGPMVDHEAARQRALAALGTISGRVVE